MNAARRAGLLFTVIRADNLIDIQGSTGLLSSRYKVYFFNSGQLSSAVPFQARLETRGFSSSLTQSSIWRSPHEKTSKSITHRMRLNPFGDNLHRAGYSIPEFGFDPRED